MQINIATKELVVAVSKQSFEDKLFAGTSGNLSIFDREQDALYITPTSHPYSLLQPDDIVVLDCNGDVISGIHRPSSEWRMHMEVYKALPHVNAIVHTHSPYATSFAVNNRTIPVVLIEMVAYLGGSIPLADFALPGTKEVGLEAVKAMGDEKTCCLLANHGALAVGSNLWQAYTRAVYVEDAAHIYSLAIANNMPVFTVPDAIVEQMKARKQSVKKKGV
jgi:L-ribulose-5-phosphate 4-epimerase